jgi:tetratricopeptide (TPR) repeat protein
LNPRIHVLNPSSTEQAVVDAIAKEYIDANAAGATMDHVHGIYSRDPVVQADGRQLQIPDYERTAAIIQQIRDKVSNVGIQQGLASMRPEHKLKLWEEISPDMSSLNLNSHDEYLNPYPREVKPVCCSSVHPINELRRITDWLARFAVTFGFPRRHQQVADLGKLQRRYRSAGALAADLNRFLNCQPVETRHASSAARLAKWRRRKPLVAALVFSIVLAIAGGLSAVTWPWQRAVTNYRNAEAHRQREEESFRQAHAAVREFHNVLFDAAEYDAPKFQELRRELMQTAVKYYDRLLRDQDGDLSLRFDIADAYYHMGFIAQTTGSKEEALQLYQQALPLWKDLTRDDPRQAEHWFYLAKVYDHVGELQSLNFKSSEARSLCRKALEIHEKLVREYPEQRIFQQHLARS